MILADRGIARESRRHRHRRADSRGSRLRAKVTSFSWRGEPMRRASRFRRRRSRPGGSIRTESSSMEGRDGHRDPITVDGIAVENVTARHYANTAFSGRASLDSGTATSRRTTTGYTGSTPTDRLTSVRAQLRVRTPGHRLRLRSRSSVRERHRVERDGGRRASHRTIRGVESPYRKRRPLERPLDRGARPVDEPTMDDPNAPVLLADRTTSRDDG